MNPGLCTDPDLRIVAPDFVLQPLLEGHASERYVSWLNDPETTRYLESRPGSFTAAGISAYIMMHSDRTDSLLLGIFKGDDECHVGNVKLEPINWEHNRATLGIMIGEADARGRGLGSRVVRCLLTFAFEQLGLHRVDLGVTSDNAAAIRSYENIGFLREACLRDAIKRGESYVDSYSYGILAKEFNAKDDA